MRKLVFVAPKTFTTTHLTQRSCSDKEMRGDSQTFTLIKTSPGTDTFMMSHTQARNLDHAAASGNANL